jgi:hypothetical protein
MNWRASKALSLWLNAYNQSSDRIAKRPRTGSEADKSFYDELSGDI